MIANGLAEQLIGIWLSSHWMSGGKAVSASTPTSVWIPVGAAVIAAAAAVSSAFLQRKTGREATAAAEASAVASHRSAKAAEDAITLNRDVAATSGARADATALAERYQNAASQLGHDKAAVRLAGVYAMSRLADDWPEERQTCIDVLCAYLRLPWLESSDNATASDEVQVRRTIVSVINRHVGEGSNASWAENDFDFSRAQLRDFFLEGCAFAGRVTFFGAEFVGDCRLINIAFRGPAMFDSCLVINKMRLAEVRAEMNGRLTFISAQVLSGAKLDISPNTSDPHDVKWMCDFKYMKVQGNLTIAHTRSFFRQPPLDLDRMELNGGCVQVISTVDLTKDKRPRYPCTILMRDWEISPGSEIDIPQKFIDDKTVEWGFTLSQTDIPADVKVSFHTPSLHG